MKYYLFGAINVLGEYCDLSNFFLSDVVKIYLAQT